MAGKNNSEENFIDEFTKEIIATSKNKQQALIKKIEIKPQPPIVQQIQPKPLLQQPRPAQQVPTQIILEQKPIQKIIFKPMEIKAPAPIVPKPTQPMPIAPPLVQQPKPIQPAQAPPRIQQPKPIQRPIQNIPVPPKIQLQPGEIDFGKILFFIRDRLITSIECPGVNKNIIIIKTGNIIKTQILLEKEEIMEIIKTFSEQAKIPLVEGMLVARIDNLEISAVVPISASASPSFIIKKEPVRMEARGPTQLMRPPLATIGQLPKQMPFIPSQAQQPIQRPPQTNPNTQNPQ